jgi:DNA-binding response OmpR family regulator
LTARILLADDSPHAQRIGARILAEEGFDVEVVSDGRQVYPALDHFSPDVVIVDVFLPTRSGFEICHWIKTHHWYKNTTRVVLTAGMMEPFDEAQAADLGCDAIIKKPFEASQMLGIVRPLAEAAQFSRGLFASEAEIAVSASSSIPRPIRADVDPERIQAAVKHALEASMPAIIKEVTERVLIALGH